MYYLLVYEPETSSLLVERSFVLRGEALQERFAAEKKYRDSGKNVEVVIVGAESREALLRTHGRYFLSLDELADRTSAAR